MVNKLSAFEARRRENVANNAKLLKDTAELGARMRRAAAPPERTVTPRKRKAAEPPVRTRVMPVRQSARLAGTAAEPADAPESPDASSIELKGNDIKRARRNGDLDLANLQVEGQRWSSADSLPSFKQGVQPGVRTFTDKDIKDTKDEKLKSLRQDLDSLSLYDGWQPGDIKITPGRVCALTFHPILDKAIVLAGDKTGTLGFFDASQKKPEYPDDEDEDFDVPLPQISAFEVHSRAITSIKIPMYDPTSVITSSYDSSIRCLDLATQVSTQLWAPAAGEEEKGVSCLDIASQATDTIIFSTLQGSLGRIDRRAKKKADMWVLTDSKVGGVSLHPILPHLVATASLDRTLKIWDLRMITGRGDSAHPALLGQHRSRLSVSHASWSQSGHIATSSYDDTVKIFDTVKAPKWKPGVQLDEEELQPCVKIPHNNQTGRWVSILKPQWQVSPGDGVHKFAIGNMNRFVDVYDSAGKQLAQLGGQGITAIPATAQLHPIHNWVAAGNGSGKLCLWQ
ncbi:WD40-repeat-containing domain protein [Xylaria sp. CBS 124048]|nr:WD40-repeat-containing domain protein [Xylaria sp. CBS 124048]